MRINRARSSRASPIVLEVFMRTFRTVKHWLRRQELSESQEHRSFHEEYYKRINPRATERFRGDLWNDYPWDEYRDVSKSWKDQTKRKHQYKLS